MDNRLEKAEAIIAALRLHLRPMLVKSPNPTVQKILESGIGTDYVPAQEVRDKELTLRKIRGYLDLIVTTARGSLPQNIRNWIDQAMEACGPGVIAVPPIPKQLPDNEISADSDKDGEMIEMPVSDAQVIASVLKLIQANKNNKKKLQEINLDQAVDLINKYVTTPAESTLEDKENLSGQHTDAASTAA